MGPPRSTAYVRFDESRCTGCAACLRNCPTRAIRIRQQKSIHLIDQCIGCGACIRTCPAGAVSAAVRPPEDIGSDHVAIALVSPVLYAQFPGVLPGAVLQGLRQLGFHHTVDMSFFLEMFQYAAEEFIHRNRRSQAASWPLISPVCPVVVRLIAFQFPSLLPHILPVLRPVALMAREVRERIIPEYQGTGREVVLYYINPCPTKGASGPDRNPKRSTHREVAIGINDLYPKLRRQVDNILTTDNVPFSRSRFEFETCSSGDAALGSMSGGEIANMNIDKSLAVHGMRETIAYLNKIEMGLLKDMEYIEFRTCQEACLGGVLAVTDKYIAKRHVQKMISVYGLGRRLQPDTIRRQYESGRFQLDKSPDVLGQIFGPRKPALSLRQAERIENTLKLLKGRDCGACGAPDCSSFAEDVVRGEADLKDCIWVQVLSLSRPSPG